MNKANDHPIPMGRLQREVARLALLDASKLVKEGHTPEEAATAACRGAWAEWRGWVLAQLTKED